MSNIFDVANSLCQHDLVLVLCDECGPTPPRYSQSVLVAYDGIRMAGGTRVPEPLSRESRAGSVAVVIGLAGFAWALVAMGGAALLLALDALTS